MSVVYVCELPEIKGKFDLEKAKALGLRPGPKYRELQLGNSVKSDHQNVMVHPSDVMGPSIPGPIVLVVDCPTESHLEALLSAKSLATYGDQVGNMSKSVACVIHLTPEFVVSCSNYQKWMKTFGSAQHIMAGHEKKNIEVPILKASARIATRLNYLCPQFFPAPGFWSSPNQNCSKPGFLASKIIDELLLEIPEVVEAAQHVSQLWQDSSHTTEDLIPGSDHKMLVEEPWLCEDGMAPTCLENIRRDDLEIVLLGTGSSQPSKYRNVTSIYINLFSKVGLLLDCGEGSLGQLKRRYGVSGADDVVRSLSCIWISRIHADHHTGLARILALRRDLLRGVPHKPVLVVGPRKLERYLDAYQRLEDLDMMFLDCKHTTEASLDDFENDLQKTVNSQDLSNNSAKINASKDDSTLFAKGSRMQSYLKIPGSPVDKDAVYPLLRKLKHVIREAGLNALISFPVVHCPQSYGVVLQAEERTNSIGKVIPGWKIVYSGDTRPCPELIEASRMQLFLYTRQLLRRTFQAPNHLSLNNLRAQPADNPASSLTAEKLLSSGLAHDPQIMNMLQQAIANPVDSIHQTQFVLQGQHPESTGNLVHGPAFVFSPVQYQASVVGASNQAKIIILHMPLQFAITGIHSPFRQLLWKQLQQSKLDDSDLILQIALGSSLYKRQSLPIMGFTLFPLIPKALCNHFPPSVHALFSIVVRASSLEALHSRAKPPPPEASKLADRYRSRASSSLQHCEKRNRDAQKLCVFVIIVATSVVFHR
ncbi:hypothetical protein KIW84_025245 [Lathyrus oleraceus]|uniref:ribonuclease Z n=1 Tax=Pisum sativum TaxID=3888 RepID=A0A9D4YHQ5_PEA|nr:hypothetical protein KIW84_025245 [Pisum sativum]